MYIIYFNYIKFTARTFTEFIPNYKNIIQIPQMNEIPQINNSQIQNNQNYNDLLQQLNNEKLKNKKLEDEIQRLKNKLNELKNNNNNLINENNNLKLKLGNSNQLNQMNQFNQMNINEINNLRQIIIQKDKEINELKLKIPNEYVKMKNIMVINFLSTDQNIRCGIPCLADDTIAEVEEKLYQQFNEFRNTNNILLSGGNIILRFKKVRENNIHNGDTILIQSAINN